AAGAAGVELVSCGPRVPAPPSDAGRGGVLVPHLSRPAGDVARARATSLALLEALTPVLAGGGTRLAWRTSALRPTSVQDLLQLVDVAGRNAALDLSVIGLAAAGLDPARAARELVGSGRVALVALGNLEPGPGRKGAFLDEGAVDVPVLVAALRDAGYGGFLRAGQPPLLTEASPWGHEGRAFDLGYLRAVLQALDHRDRRPPR
ncbi:MAG: hypothetical protein ABIL09_06860, partial [Gemmatimonadota bacterium]